MKKILQATLFVALTLVANFQPLTAQTTEKKVVLQAFWWDYWNSNHPGSWANYLTELAPRIKAMGIDAVWIPPISKGNTGEGSVGYDIFDHYDLGDKYQKGSLNTRIGTKDELLRMIAVMHANGIEVIQDIVLNHTIGAGDLDGSLGLDPSAPDDQYKTFRYASYGKHAIYSSTDNYKERSGRWPKNYQNFHPNTDHNCNSGDICSQYFGPDICYYSNAIGQSSDAVYNPSQSTDYMRNEARNWVIWLKKQTAVDGFRWDATKHFPTWVQQDLSYNLKYNAGWANGGESMFNVGEYVDFNGTNLDSYVDNVTNSNSGSDFLLGTFDFSLRDGIKSMVNGNGYYDMSLIPATQQSRRVAYYNSSNTYVHRTVPFVNNHDTFRPQVDADGNYIGWNTGSELAPHIDPFNDRMPLAYAIAFAVDGSPQIFFEDLFNLGNTSKRYSHEPNNSTDLPVRSPLQKIISLHQQLNFKDGAYKVRTSSGAYFPSGSSAADLLIIERSAKAIIAINDNGASAQEAWIDTDFPAGTILVDHAGYVAGTSTVQPDQRALVSAPAVDPSNGTYGFAIWGPQGTLPTYTPSRTTSTTQEWEMNDDLGDSHPYSLKQGGRIPDNSTEWRYAGKIFPEANQNVSFELYADATKDLTIEFIDVNQNVIYTTNGTGNLTGFFTPTIAGWINVRIRNTNDTQTGQVCYVKITYTAPATITDVDAFTNFSTYSEWTGTISNQWNDAANWANNLVPSEISNVYIPSGATYAPEISTAVKISAITIAPNASCVVSSSGSLEADLATLEADENGYAVLQSLGNTQINDNLTQQQHLAETGWHQIAAPTNSRIVSDWGTIGQNAPGGTANTQNLYTWDAQNATWVNIDDGSTSMQTGIGYNLFVGDYGVVQTPQTISVSGDATSSYTPILQYGTNPNNGDGWNFIGHSLSAPLDFTSLSKTEVQNAFYIWDPATSAYKSWSLGGINDPYIAPMQGFWVKATSANAPSLGTLDFSHTTTANTAYYKSLLVNSHVVLHLNSAADTTLRDELIFGLYNEATDAFDQNLDALKKKNNTNGLNIFSIAANHQLAINTIAYEEDEEAPKILPIGFENLSENHNYCLQLQEKYLHNNLYVYLRINETLEALTATPFCFDYQANGNYAIVLSHFPIKENNAKQPEILAYATKAGISVTLLSKETAQAQLFDIAGRLLYSGNLRYGENNIALDLTHGTYILVVSENGQPIATQKIPK